MEMKRANHDNEKSQSVGPNINIKQSTLLVGKRMPAIIRRNIDMCDYAFHTYGAKLLQKSEMRKDIVIELSYKGFG